MTAPLDPYATPGHYAPLPELHSPRGFRWVRVLVWAVLIVLAETLVGFLGGLSFYYWSIYGETPEAAAANRDLVMQIALVLVSTLLYWNFAAGITTRRLLHVIATYLLVQFAARSALFVMIHLLASPVPTDRFIDPWALGKTFLTAMAGLGIANLTTWLRARKALVHSRS